MTRFHEQINEAIGDDKFNPNYDKYIGYNDDWILQDYKDFCDCMEAGFIIQECGDCFIINKDHIEAWRSYGADNYYYKRWEYSQEFGDLPIEETNDDCSDCGIILSDDDMNMGTGRCEQCEDNLD